ncbi:glycosyltransferase [Algibacter miyuki]|uniref:Glycosyltransferase n=1 Tax=Algibacter miyuki TaxID=1306933 RepID=A0ABV5H2G2_9FLAO|nr:hypothetical protein [Algibacter miyuki]MDN3666506.1 hypothetical protein [Algibacter miyuki]
MKVYIDRTTDIYYASFYIEGLKSVFGERNVRFSNKYFDAFKHNNNYFAFVLKDEKGLRKIIIDFGDSEKIFDTPLQWSDAYFKINLAFDEENRSNKIVSIGPSFGTKIYGLFKTLWFASINLVFANKRIHNKRKFLSDYKAQFNRKVLRDYYPSKRERKYVYFVASLWKKEGRTNLFRSNFIKACLENEDVNFEGGFAPRTKKDITGFESLTMSKRDDFSAFVSKTKKSNVVFNTPAVLSCHGWKLAEFLCFGKAIISTPISRQLPEELEDHVHVMITNGTQDDISNVLNDMLNNEGKLQCLEVNSRNYFDKHLAPEAVINKILKQ